MARKFGKKRREKRDVYDQFYAQKHWRKASVAFRKANPLCVKCAARGRTTPAALVDHIVERKDGGADYALDNLQSLCHRCHNSKTHYERARRQQMAAKNDVTGDTISSRPNTKEYSSNWDRIYGTANLPKEPIDDETAKDVKKPLQDDL